MMDDDCATYNTQLQALEEPLTVESLLKTTNEIEEKIISTMDQEMVANFRRWYPEAKLKHFYLMEDIILEQKMGFHLSRGPSPYRFQSFSIIPKVWMY
jgi:hypothetical protein